MTIVITTTHYVIEHAYLKVPNIPSRIYASVAWMMAPKVTRFVIHERVVLLLPIANFKDKNKVVDRNRVGMENTPFK